MMVSIKINAILKLAKLAYDAWNVNIYNSLIHVIYKHIYCMNNKYIHQQYSSCACKS